MSIAVIVGLSAAVIGFLAVYIWGNKDWYKYQRESEARLRSYRGSSGGTSKDDKELLATIRRGIFIASCAS